MYYTEKTMKTRDVRSFEGWNAFSKFVLRGAVSMFSMKDKVSAHDKLKSKGEK